MSQCPNGHEVSPGQRFCPECGAPLEDLPSGPAAQARGWSRRRRGLAAAGAAAVVLVAAGVAVAGTRSGTTTGRGPALRRVSCARSRSGPAGTNLVSFGIDENTPTRMVLEARFDGDVPPHATQDAGSISLDLNLYLFTAGDDTHPYDVLVNQLSGNYGVQAGRIGRGFIDSSGFVLHISGDAMRVEFNPAVFTQLPAGRWFPMGAETSVSRFVSNGRQLGFFEIGRQQCPGSNQAKAATAAPTNVPTTIDTASVTSTSSTPVPPPMAASGTPSNTTPPCTAQALRAALDAKGWAQGSAVLDVRCLSGFGGAHTDGVQSAEILAQASGNTWVALDFGSSISDVARSAGVPAGVWTYLFPGEPPLYG